MSGYPGLSIHIYDDTVLVPDIGGDLERAMGLGIDHGWPGGRDLAASFFVARAVTRPMLFRPGHKLEIKNGAVTVFHGKIANIGIDVAGSRSGNRFEVLGDWGDILMLRRIQKYWADNRLIEAAWREIEGPYPKAKVGRSEELRITASGDFAVDEVACRLRYTMPTSQTIRRVVLDYEMAEMAEWRPQGVMHYDDSLGTYTEINDGDSFALDGNDWLYIWGREELLNMTGIRFEFSAVNNNAAVMDCKVYSSAWTNVGALADGTLSGGAMFGASGDVTFTEIEACKEHEVNGKSGRFIRIGASALLDQVTVTKIAFLMQQAWELRLRDRDGAINIWSVTASGAGSRDDTLVTPRQYLELQLVSRAAQNAPSNGSIYGLIKSVMVYSETGGTNLTEIAKDVQGAISRLSTYQGYIQSNGYEISPFMSDWETAADILQAAAQKGDGAGNSWACGLLPPSAAPAPDGKPVLFVQPFPDLSTYTYSLSFNDPNLVGELNLEDEILDTRNYEIRKWTGEDGFYYWVSPLDDTTLRDAESDDLYGRKDHAAEAGQASQADVLAEARRHLEAHKSRAGYVSSPIRVKGWIYDQYGCRIPAALVMPGVTIRLRDYLYNWRIYLIVHTHYDADADICEITVDKGKAGF